MIRSTGMAKTEPCDSCPFRSDRDIHLNPGVAKEIADGLRKGGSQPCWETVADYDEQGVPVYSPEEQHCAGALLVMEKVGQRTEWMKWATKIGRYDKTALSQNTPTFRSLWAFESEMTDRFEMDSIADLIKPVGLRARPPAPTLTLIET